ncbi:hypothetical protein ANTQUA_LOCUS6863 [Anthophora quadrimaculata]
MKPLMIRSRTVAIVLRYPSSLASERTQIQSNCASEEFIFNVTSPLVALANEKRTIAGELESRTPRDNYICARRRGIMEDR